MSFLEGSSSNPELPRQPDEIIQILDVLDAFEIDSTAHRSELDLPTEPDDIRRALDAVDALEEKGLLGLTKLQPDTMDARQAMEHELAVPGASERLADEALQFLAAQSMTSDSV